MQDRHSNRKKYFQELSYSCEKYYLPYVQSFYKSKPFDEKFSVLEIGCGEGGNLLPFARLGCRVAGIDIASTRIEQAIAFFKEEGIPGNFFCGDIFSSSHPGEYDLIIIHDVIEHVRDKRRLLEIAASLLSPEGVVYVGFPAWQMPFGGHQQICRNKYVSHLPFVHLLPSGMYRKILEKAGESKETVEELIDIKRCATSVELFKKVLKETPLHPVSERYYFINPHYEIKFNLSPRTLIAPIRNLPFVRNFFTTSYFCLLAKESLS